MERGKSLFNKAKAFLRRIWRFLFDALWIIDDAALLENDVRFLILENLGMVTLLLEFITFLLNLLVMYVIGYNVIIEI